MEQSLERIPMTGEGNAYHALWGEIGYSFKAYPADVPVPPDGEIGPFTILMGATDRSFLDEAELNEYRQLVQKHISNVNELEKLYEQIGNRLDMLRVEVSDVVPLDGTVPGKVRMELNLPDPDIQERSAMEEGLALAHNAVSQGN